MKIQRSVRLSPEVDEALRVMADRQQRSVSQLVEMAVRNQYISSPGFLSSDGRESERAKANRERGGYWPGTNPDAASLPKPPKPPESRDGSLRPSRPERHEFQSGEDWQAAVRTWKAER